jgi:hypothetical protein
MTDIDRKIAVIVWEGMMPEIGAAIDSGRLWFVPMHANPR